MSNRPQALHCPNPADPSAQPAYEPSPPMQPEIEGRSSLGHQQQPADLGAQPRKFGYLAAGLFAAKAQRGRRPKYTVENLVECLSGKKLSTNEFRQTTNKRCGISRAMFYRLLQKGQKELRFRQRDDTSGPWEPV
jgi:hypothetical protein